MPGKPPKFKPEAVPELVKQNEQLRAELDAVRKTAEELSKRIRSVLETAAEQDAERRNISKEIRRRMKGPGVADDTGRRAMSVARPRARV